MPNPLSRARDCAEEEDADADRVELAMFLEIERVVTVVFSLVLIWMLGRGKQTNRR
jgi:hypothetical protein